MQFHLTKLGSISKLKPNEWIFLSLIVIYTHVINGIHILESFINYTFLIIT